MAWENGKSQGFSAPASDPVQSTTLALVPDLHQIILVTIVLQESKYSWILKKTYKAVMRTKAVNLRVNDSLS